MSERRIPIMLLPPVPVVPRRDFTKLELDEDTRDHLWDIIGPTVHYNLGHGLEGLRDAFVAVYWQGLENGSSAAVRSIKAKP
jgi:hypothetical protein